MKNPMIYLIGVVVVAGGVFFLINTITRQNQVLRSDIGTQNDNKIRLQEKPETDTQQVNTTQTNEPSQYLTYSQSGFEAALNKKRVYFFHANWCPTCRAANEEFTQKLEKIPSDVVLFKTDYDTEKELKKQYGITYQHTFVLVDKDGNQLKKWNGGAIEELVTNTQ